MVVGIFCFCILLLVCGYIFYGRRIERELVLEPEKRMPSDELVDGIDYVSTPTPVLFGHHFSSIAGAGPIVGPIIAAAAFGWLPTLAWIIVGSIFVGAVHDYTAALASVNNRGMSMGQICRKYFKPATYVMMLVFLWLTLSYVIIVFLDLTAGTMTPPAVEHVGFCENGSVATASVLYILIAMIYGIVVRKFKVGFKKASLLFIPLVFFALYVGYRFPITFELLSNVALSPKDFWLTVLIGYCFVASIMPVWLLLQPRDYLSSFLLYASLGIGAAGLVISGIGGKLAIEQPALLSFSDEKLGFLFPALFITVACGAVSGFHSLVSAGTTAKQLERKRSILPVVYGSMLVEAVLAVLAVVAVMIVAKIPEGQLPTVTFANALGLFAEACGFSHQVGLVFALLAINTFLLTTLDTCTRLTRFIVEEFIGRDFPFRRYLTTLAGLAFPAFMCFVRVGGKPAWIAVWPAFGTTNQLLAAITLIVVSVWLFKSGRKVVYTVPPMLFMLLTAGYSLAVLSYSRISQGDYIIGVISVVMFIMAVVLVLDSSRVFLKGKSI
ncbi:MAG: carbon starvation protein A [Victivallales bacterium]|nr:carbon starvation protein A [Victivallales bacterium]